jgi:general stress protein YciG
MLKHRVLSFKPQLRLEWRGQDGQNETEQPDHSASLGDSVTSSTQIRFSVHKATLYRKKVGLRHAKMDANGMLAMPRQQYVFEHYLFTSRRGSPPTPWFWEIRRKNKPGERSLAGGPFRSAREAEAAGRIVLAQVREALLEERRQDPRDERQERLSQIARKELKIAEARANRKPLTPEQRSENARIAAYARAKAISPERRSEIGRMGGAASKGKPKKKRDARPTGSK